MEGWEEESHYRQGNQHKGEDSEARDNDGYERYREW